MNRILLLTYARPIVPAECVIAAVNSVSAAFLGRDGVVFVTDAVKDGRACVLVLVNGPLDNVLARLPQNVAGVPVFALQNGALRPLADAPTFASAGDPAASGKPPWADSTDNHPVNPFALARLMTGKVVQTRDELVAAFGMPLDKILAVGGPLYAPDLAAIAARRSQAANGSVKGSKPAGAVGDAPKNSQKITPPKSSVAQNVKLASGNSPAAVTGYRDPILDQIENFSGGVIGCAEWLTKNDQWRSGTLIHYGLADATNAQKMAQRVTNACRDSGIAPATDLNVRPGETTKTRDWVTPVQDPAVREHYTEDPTTIAARRAWSRLNTYFPCPNGVCDTCHDWRRLTPDAKRELLLSYEFSLAGVTRENVAEVVANINARCAAIASSASYRGVRDHNRLLTATGHGRNDWAELTCQEQFNALARINADLVPPRVTIDEMKRELWEQWAAIQRFSPVPRSWFDWSNIGSYAHRNPSVLDPHQGCVGNCYLIASLAGAAWVRPSTITSRSWRGAGASAIRASGNSLTITFADPRSGALADHPVALDSKLPIRITDGDLCDGPRPFCHTGDSNQTWPDLWEKAMRVWVSGQQYPVMANSEGHRSTLYFVSPTVSPAVNIAGGDGQTRIAWVGARGVSSGIEGALSALGFMLSDGNPTVEEVWAYLGDHCDASGKVRSIMFATSIPIEWSPIVSIVRSHCYTLLGIDRARRMVYLRNPWGHLSPGAASDQRGSWMGLTLGLDDGVGVVALGAFHDNFWNISGNWYAPRRAYDTEFGQEWA